MLASSFNLFLTGIRSRNKDILENLFRFFLTLAVENRSKKCSKWSRTDAKKDNQSCSLLNWPNCRHWTHNQTGLFISNWKKYETSSLGVRQLISKIVSWSIFLLRKWVDKVRIQIWSCQKVLLMLTRFHRDFRTKNKILDEGLIDLLKSAPGNTMSLTNCRQELGEGL